MIYIIVVLFFICVLFFLATFTPFNGRIRLLNYLMSIKYEILTDNIKFVARIILCEENNFNNFNTLYDHKIKIDRYIQDYEMAHDDDIWFFPLFQSDGYYEVMLTYDLCVRSSERYDKLKSKYDEYLTNNFNIFNIE